MNSILYLITTINSNNKLAIGLNVPAASVYRGQESVMAYMIVLVTTMKKIAISEKQSKRAARRSGPILLASLPVSRLERNCLQNEPIVLSAS
jgi:hypothetical protein